MKTIIAIDPGANGGMAISKDGKFVGCWPMPETEREISDMLHDVRFEHILDAIDKTEPPICFIEAVHSFPGQGVASSFTFGKGYGVLLGALTALKFRIEKVSPQKWQKALGITKSDSKGDHKRKLKAKAQELFPQAKVTLKTADALLLLEYANKQ